jgi:hypothetical protein
MRTKENSLSPFGKEFLEKLKEDAQIGWDSQLADKAMLLMNGFIKKVNKLSFSSFDLTADQSLGKGKDKKSAVHNKRSSGREKNTKNVLFALSETLNDEEKSSEKTVVESIKASISGHKKKPDGVDYLLEGNEGYKAIGMYMSYCLDYEYDDHKDRDINILYVVLARHIVITFNAFPNLKDLEIEQIKDAFFEEVLDKEGDGKGWGSKSVRKKKLDSATLTKEVNKLVNIKDGEVSVNKEKMEKAISKGISSEEKKKEKEKGGPSK